MATSGRHRVRGCDTRSVHSWGATIDQAPKNYGLRLPRQQATMPQLISAIFQAEGWIRMGHARDYDYMHFQAASLLGQHP